MKFKDLEKRLACDKPNRVHPKNPTCIVWYNGSSAEIYGIGPLPPSNIENVRDRIILDYDDANSCPYARLAKADPELIYLEHAGFRVYSPVIGSPKCRRLRPGIKRVLKQIAEFRIKKGYDPAPSKKPKQTELKF
jgi:hypothetical protein